MTNICLAFLGSGVSFIFGYTHILLAPNGAPHVNLPTVNDVGECEYIPWGVHASIFGRIFFGFDLNLYLYLMV